MDIVLQIFFDGLSGVFADDSCRGFSIGNQADALRASTDATQLSHNTQRRSFAAQGMTAQARDNDFDKIGQAFFPFYRSNSNMLCAASL
jgi:hypothetical protein